MYVLKEPQEFNIDKAGIKGKIFSTQNLTSKTQYFLVETEKGHETTIIEHKCDFIYYVLEGSGYFEIEGEKENCEKGNLVVIPAGKKFTYKGKLKMMATSTPPWRAYQEETLIQ
jgi:mannose-6-phosphate isomerase-like protein (cupin superfamily)